MRDGFAGILVLALLLALAPNGAVLAESHLRLEAPESFETIQATTFDKSGDAVGQSSFEIETRDSGAHHMKIELAVASGGVNRSEATLAIVPAPEGGEPRLQLTEQRAQATRSDGVSLDLLVIDHVKRRASCYPSNEPESAGNHIDLPEDDRVVNVPLQLLFKPLARGEVENVRFQLVLCRSGPVLQDMVAVRGPGSHEHGRDVIEIRFGPDLGNAIAWFASRLLPRYSFWFDAEDGDYLGHRMPLHRKGPMILLVRDGLEPPDLGLAMK